MHLLRQSGSNTAPGGRDSCDGCVARATHSSEATQPGARWTTSTYLPARKIEAHGTRIFAGQPDPSDESHFTIAFETDEKDGRGIIERVVEGR